MPPVNVCSHTGAVLTVTHTHPHTRLVAVRRRHRVQTGGTILQHDAHDEDVVDGVGRRRLPRHSLQLAILGIDGTVTQTTTAAAARLGP
jgi:hypothetical protein